MKQKLEHAMMLFEQLELAMHDLNLGHMADTLVTMQEQIYEELGIDDNDTEYDGQPTEYEEWQSFDPDC